MQFGMSDAAVIHEDRRSTDFGAEDLAVEVHGATGVGNGQVRDQAPRRHTVVGAGAIYGGLEPPP